VCVLLMRAYTSSSPTQPGGNEIVAAACASMGADEPSFVDAVAQFAGDVARASTQK
jgi:hypothetical protein